MRGNSTNLDEKRSKDRNEGLEDEVLEAEYNEQTAMPMHHPPWPTYTQDTWTNIVDHSPQMPSRSQLGWDGRSEFFEGQVKFTFSYLITRLTSIPNTKYQGK